MIIGEVVCSDCGMYADGYSDAEKDYTYKLKESVKIATELHQALRLARLVCKEYCIPESLEIIDSALSSFKSD